MINPHRVQVPQFEFSSQSLDAAQKSMEHVPEHVTAIKRHDRYQVGETKQDVHPHQPEKKVGEEHQDIRAQNTAKQSVIGHHQGFFKRMNGYPSQFERNDEHAEDVEWNGERPLPKRALKAR